MGFPTLLCHRLITDETGRVVSYQLRQKDPKRQSVLAFKSLYYRIIAAGDSYNDTTMLGEADAGILFHAPDNVIREFPQFPAVHTFDELKKSSSRRRIGIWRSRRRAYTSGSCARSDAERPERHANAEHWHDSRSEVGVSRRISERLKRFQQHADLGEGFLIFSLAARVRHNAAAAPTGNAPILDQQAADGD